MVSDNAEFNKGRTPSGVRGLKWRRTPYSIFASQSHPVRGAWIEMAIGAVVVAGHYIVAPRQGCVD